MKITHQSLMQFFDANLVMEMDLDLYVEDYVDMEVQHQAEDS